MKDINFFAEYVGKKKEQKNNAKYIYSSVGVLGAFIVGSLIYNSVSLHVVNKEIADITEKINAPQVQEKLLEAEVVAEKHKFFSEYNDDLTEVISNMQNRQVVSTQLINSLSSTLPTEVSFNSLNISGGEIAIQAESSTMEAIAEVQYNLKKLSQIEYVYIGAISGNDVYSFDIKCVLKDGE